ncbi:retrovirus-related pol polyprotein from transposon TNT 1-94 [Tanacetum coccineum]
MKDPKCVKNKVKIAPHDYSKENYLATFTPQKQLTPEQIFWSNDLLKLKAEALKEQTTVSRPIKALMVYPPNTPATLVPRVLPTKIQVKINIFALIQLFLEFEKTCKKRITPTGLTEGERGFEQTKECYLTEVIPFFKTLKEHFEGIQKALTKEIKEIKEIFEELEAEVDQNVMDRKYDEIEQKNLLIANDNLIVDCLSKEVFYIATNSELTISRFTEMHDAYTVIKARCLELEAKLSKLKDKIQKDDHNELVKHFSNLESSCTGRYVIDVKPLPPRIRNNREAHLDYLNHLKESVETLREIVKEARVERPIDRSLAYACLYTKHSQELTPTNIGDPTVQILHLRLFSNAGRIDRPLVFGLRLLKTYDRGSLMAQEFHEKVYRDRYTIWKEWDTICFLSDNFVTLISKFRKHSCYVRDIDGVEVIKGSRVSNLYTISVKDMMKSSPICLLSKASKNKSWLWHRRLNHLNFGTINDLAKKDLVRGLPRLMFKKYHLCSACQLGKSKKHTHTSKTKNTNLEVLNTLHMDLCGPMREQTINGKKYILVIVDDYSRFTWVKFLRSKDETSEFVIKFLKQIQVGLNKTVRYIRTDNGTEFVNQVLTKYYESVGIFHHKSVLRTTQQNGIVER